MWIVVQGIGAADSLWNVAITQLSSGGTAIPPAVNQSLWKPADALFESQVCVYALQKQYGDSNAKCTVDGNTINCGDGDNGLYGPDACGKITASSDGAGVNTAIGNAFSQMIMVTGPAAEQIVNDPTIKVENIQSGAIIGAVNAYQSIVGDAVRANTTINSSEQSQIAQAESGGWIMAGRYYYTISQYSSSQANPTLPIPSIPITWQTSNELNSPSGNSPYDYISDNFYNVNGGQNNGPVPQYENSEEQSAYEVGSLPSYLTDAHVFGATILGSKVDDAIGQWNDMFTNITQKHADPIYAVQSFGAQLLGDGWAGWQDTALAITGIEAGLSVGAAIPFVGKSASTLATAVMTLVSWFLPLAMAVYGLMFVGGATMGLYLPLIPFIIFTFAAIGWMIGVVEGMVAAPIVALGVMHPDGQHDLWGKAEPAIMLVINMFIRPALMIVGMIVGISLGYVAIELLNYGFVGLTTGDSGLSSVMGASILVPVTFMAIYGGILVLILQKSFDMIHVIPDKVLRWIQGGDVTREQFGEMGQAQQQLARQMSQGGQQISSGKSQGSQQGTSQTAAFGNKMQDSISNFASGARQSKNQSQTGNLNVSSNSGGKGGSGSGSGSNSGSGSGGKPSGGGGNTLHTGGGGNPGGGQGNK